MNTMNFFAALCIITTMTAQSAADGITTMVPITSQDITKSVFGFVPSARGSCASIQSLGSNEKPNLLLTLVYSEHPILRKHDAEKLQLISQSIDCLVKNEEFSFDDSEKFSRFCASKMKEYIPDPLTDRQPKDFVQVAIKPTYSLIALCIKLNSQCMEFVGCIPNYDEYPCGSLSLLIPMPGGHLPKSAKAECHIPFLSSKSITDPQAEAELVQKEKPENPFTAIIDLDAWRKIVEAHRSTRLDESSN
jgi:hypothetical protein